jgi:hypothetical protein
VLDDWDNAETSEPRATLPALLAGDILVVHPHGKRAGCTFDPNRVRIG